MGVIRERTRSRAASGHAVAGATAVLTFLLVLIWTGWTPERWVDVDSAKADSWNWRLSIASADASLVLLAVTLGIGPVRVLRGGRPRTHIPARRAFGVWSGGLALIHVAFALFIHAEPIRVWSNWVTANPFGPLGGYRGLANWLGLVQVALVLVLLWLSRDTALRKLGAPIWKRLQRSVYVLGVLVAMHALLYQLVEDRLLVHSVALAAVVAAAGVLQLGGAWAFRGRGKIEASR
ncbi:MAG: ferric reductase-like transmembrane domain-containing protein [Acidimicrobiia bacterium]|nr:ferric reductase-like transmembrane domain-containing protein [Acidimicrobiia bacterium]